MQVIVSASFCFCCTTVLCTAVQLYTHGRLAGCWVVGAIAVQLYCCWSVLLLLSPATARSPGRSCCRSRAATVARVSLGRRRRSPAAARSLARSPARHRSLAVARPPSPARSLPSIARHRSPAVALVLFCFRNFLIPHAMIPTFHHHILPYFEVGQPLSPSYSQQQQQQQHSITTQHPECLADAELVRFTPSLSP